MKKQIKKLSLNKKTISNLTDAEMSKHNGGGSGWTCTWTCGQCVYTHRHYGCGGATRNGNTCEGHNTCQYTCV